ncbi:DUF305 domain-containing protein [Micromonospora peucetia]|uniref:DUF305 domain-containing protein n=1 Tax=Micromonospora peucetia TaxID=47871 RepID=A0A1C6U1T0_9ACTN|nr:DUF305 domain-containing protein [Micromonospora peucetia]MCX4385890.1 DUF305 domain-containing protein [Micromonospora peucetia]WSA33267.1 DUF305 domain-containing protein [Micromonospora peucetia]SCL47839.1 Uncharacterized conserved protein, DUF305 family [Micromonospora peucetia]
MRPLRTVVLLTVLLLVPACTAQTAPASPEPAPPGRAATTGAEMSGLDVVFLAMSAAHIEQTLEMVRLSRDRVTDRKFRTLVAAIEVTETDELATMRGWLRDAGPAAAEAARRHDHGQHGTAAEDMARLRTAPDGEVDGVLLELLAPHQDAAADLARAHQTVGTDPRVRDLAARVERSRTAQVSLMAELASARR